MTDRELHHLVEDRHLFRRLYEPLRRYAAVVAGPGIDPDDLVQESLVRRLSIGPLSELEHPGAYLRRSMLNIEMNRKRSAGRRERRELLASVPVAESPGYPSDLADLAGLDPKDRVLLFLHEVEGWTYAEIGEEMGEAEPTLRGRAVTARKKLKKNLSMEDQR